MAYDLTWIQIEATTDAWSAPTITGHIVPTFDTVRAITNAKVIAVLAELNRYLADPTLPSPSPQRTTYETARNTLRADANTAGLRTSLVPLTNPTSQIQVLETYRTRLQHPVSTQELTRIINDFDSFTAFHGNAILSNQDLILWVAWIRHAIEQKSVPVPPPTVNRPAAGATVTALPINFSWLCAGNQVIEIFEDGNTTPIGTVTTWAWGVFALDVPTITNGTKRLRVRATNPTTNVYAETPLTITVRCPVAAVAPTNIHVTSPAQGQYASISGTLVTMNHIPVICDEAGVVLPINPGDRTLDPTTGNFSIRIPPSNTLPPWNHNFILRIIGGGGTPDYDHRFEITVTPGARNFQAPNFWGYNAGPPTIYQPGDTAHPIPYWTVNPTIQIDNPPAAGSEIKITWEWITHPINMIAWNAPPPLNLTLQGLRAESHTWTQRISIQYSNPQNGTVQPVNYPIDLIVTHGHHYAPNNRRVDYTSFHHAVEHGDPVQYPPDNREYQTGRTPWFQGLPRRYFVQVPLMPWSRWWGWRDVRTFQSRSIDRLYHEVNNYINSLNARIWNSSEHWPHSPHSSSNEPTAPTNRPDGAQDGWDRSHGETSHATESASHGWSGGTFFDRMVWWISGGLLGVRNAIPQGVRTFGGNTAVSVRNGAIVWGLTWVVAAVTGSALLSWFAFPVGIGVGAITLVRRYMKNKDGG